MRLFKKRRIGKLLKPQEKITKKIWKEYNEYGSKFILSNEGNIKKDLDKLSEIQDRYIESIIKERNIRMKFMKEEEDKRWLKENI